MSLESGPWSWSTWLAVAVAGLVPLAISCDVVRVSDIALLFGVTIFRNWKWALRILQSYDLRPLFGIARGAALAFILTQVGAWVVRTIWARTEGSSNEGPRPLFFPSRTTHTRMFPKSHSFSYSYLLVGIPVGWKGSVGAMLAADQGASRLESDPEDGSPKRSWYTVEAADYLDRGHGYLGLDGKLRKFLQSQGQRHEDYPYAYLLTAPKFLGYSFNPVSFWYLYSKTRELTAMVLEVNNTFDERHLYFLKPSEETIKTSDVQGDMDAGLFDSSLEGSHSLSPENLANSGKPTRFTNSWSKEFHVSPFNSRKGVYSLVAYDPLYPLMSGRGPINNTITLKSSKAHSKLVARIFSQGVAEDPATMNGWGKAVFLSSWWWVGFVTFPRIVREASRLFFKRKLHVWFRPEPLKNSMGRNADATERIIEASFREYLKFLVGSAPLSLVVNYSSAGISDGTEEMMTSEMARANPSGARILEFKVLTPVFFSRFVHYAHDLEAFCEEVGANGTLWVSEPSLLPHLVLKKPQPVQVIPNWINYLSFKVIQKLRQRPARIDGPTTSAGFAKARNKAAKKGFDMRGFRLSAMDGYILTHGTLAEQRRYRNQVLKLFLSDWIGLGNVHILGAEIFLLKLVVVWILAGCLLIAQ